MKSVLVLCCYVTVVLSFAEAFQIVQKSAQGKVANFLQANPLLEKRFRRELIDSIHGNRDRRSEDKVIFEDNCGGTNIPLVSCNRNYCRDRSCRNHPNAECRLNLCGKCRALYYVNDERVDCGFAETITELPQTSTVTERREELRCFKEQEIALTNRKHNSFIVDCHGNGSYNALQCWPSVGLCWCVNNLGEELFGTRTYFPSKPNCQHFIGDCHNQEFGCCPDDHTAAKGLNYEGCPGVKIANCYDTRYGCCLDQTTSANGPNNEGCPRLPTKCEYIRAKARQSFHRGFEPSCDSTGKFELIQCYGLECWCVNHDGRELEKTRVAGSKPDCSIVVCEDRRTDCKTYSKVSGFCQQIEHYMKEYCRKSCGYCKQTVSAEYVPRRPGCSSDFGCCSDFVTPAKGVDDFMCPVYTSDCQMPKVTGECRAAFQKFYYNTKINKCELFIYGGCRGNGNNFRFKYECEEKCVHEITTQFLTTPTPKQTPSLGSGVVVHPTDGLSGPASHCNSNFGCCEDGITPSLDPEGRSCPYYSSLCVMPPATGPCRGSFVRYFFNPETQDCEQFIYGGCGGNKNNFNERNRCVYECYYNNKGTEKVVTKKTPTTTTTTMTTTTEPPTSTLHRSRTTPSTPPQKNPPISLRSATDPSTKEFKPEYTRCYLPPEIGDCRGYFVRFHFNPISGYCERFIYGGCGGNGNNFRDRNICVFECVEKQTTTPRVTTSKVETTVELTEATVTTAKRETTTPRVITGKAGTTVELTEATLTTAKRETTTPRVTTTTTRRQTPKITESPTTIKTQSTRTTKTTVTKSTAKSTKELSTAKSPTESECNIRKKISHRLTTALTFLPRCAVDGSFEKIQCWKEQGYCWCVDQDGNEIEATRSPDVPVCPKFKDPTCQDVLPLKCARYSKQKSYCEQYKSFMIIRCPRSCNFCRDHLYRPGCGSEYGCCDDGYTPRTADTDSCPKYKDICVLPANKGKCLGYMERFYFDRNDGRCKDFIYSGCGGNLNNFMTEQECFMRCQSIDKDDSTSLPTTVSTIHISASSERTLDSKTTVSTKDDIKVTDATTDAPETTVSTKDDIKVTDATTDAPETTVSTKDDIKVTDATTEPPKTTVSTKDDIKVTDATTNAPETTVSTKDDIKVTDPTTAPPKTTVSTKDDITVTDVTTAPPETTVSTKDDIKVTDATTAPPETTVSTKDDIKVTDLTTDAPETTVSTKDDIKVTDPTTAPPKTTVSTKDDITVIDVTTAPPETTVSTKDDIKVTDATTDAPETTVSTKDDIKVTDATTDAPETTVSTKDDIKVTDATTNAPETTVSTKDDIKVTDPTTAPPKTTVSTKDDITVIDVTTAPPETTVSTKDDIKVTDATTDAPETTVSTKDDIKVTDATTDAPETTVSTKDDIKVTDATTNAPETTVSTKDDIKVTDPTTAPPKTTVSTKDDITVTDVTTAPPETTVSTKDDIKVTDATTDAPETTVSTKDDIKVTDATTDAPETTVSTKDDIKVTDATTKAPETTVSTKDDIKVTDPTTAPPKTTVSTKDDITVTDVTTAPPETTVSTKDDIKVTDATTDAPETTVSTKDDIKVTDATTAPPETTVSTKDDIKVTDATTAPPKTTVSTKDDITVTDVTTTPPETTVNTKDDIKVTDATTNAPETTVSTKDDIKVTDPTTAPPETTVSTKDDITVTDVTTDAPETTVSTKDDIKVTDPTTAPPETTVSTKDDIKVTDPTTAPPETTVSTKDDIEITDATTAPLKTTVSTKDDVEVTVSTTRPPRTRLSTEGDVVVTDSTTRPPRTTLSTEGDVVMTDTTTRPPRTALSTEGDVVVTDSTTQPPRTTLSTEGDVVVTDSTTWPPRTTLSTEGDVVVTDSTIRPPRTTLSTEGDAVVTDSTTRPPRTTLSTEGDALVTDSTTRPPRTTMSTEGDVVVTDSTTQPPRTTLSTEGDVVMTDTTTRPPRTTLSTEGNVVVTDSTTRPPRTTLSTEGNVVVTDSIPQETTLHTTDDHISDFTRKFSTPTLSTVGETTQHIETTFSTTDSTQSVETIGTVLTTMSTDGDYYSSSSTTDFTWTTTDEWIYETSSTDGSSSTSSTFVTSSTPQYDESTTDPYDNSVIERSTRKRGSMPPTSRTASSTFISLASVCNLYPIQGNCDAFLPRYYYDLETKRCKLFLYSGCNGNGNNFFTEMECNEKCSVAVHTTTQGTTTLSIQERLLCGSQYGCCTDKITPAMGENLKGCPAYNSSCEMPPARGPCRAYITRWYYHSKDKLCKEFLWGGCEGNRNSYSTDVECSLQCEGVVVSVGNEVTGNEGDGFEEIVHTVILPGCGSEYGCCEDGITPAQSSSRSGCPTYDSDCDMPIVKGECGERLVRYVYDHSSKECTSVLYSGCGGNRNNFVSMDECRTECEKDSKCKDRWPSHCANWNKVGQCERRPAFMQSYCKKSCGVCT